MKVLSILSALTFAVCVAACSSSADSERSDAADFSTPSRNATPTRPITVSAENLTVVRSGRVTSGPLLSGSLVARREASLRAQVAATVIGTYAEVGQRVRRGERLAQLDGNALQSIVRSSRSAVGSAQVAVDNARRELARQQRLLEIEAAAVIDVDVARATLANAEAALADATSRHTSAQQQAAYATITSPIDGAVSGKSVSVGDGVQPGSTLYSVVDPTSMRLEASVAADELGSIRVGASVRFAVRGYPTRTFAGRIVRVSPAADPVTRQVQVFATIPNVRAALVTGLFAIGRVASDSASGLVVPVAAIDARRAIPAVVRVRRGIVERVPVTLGLRDEQSQQVLVISGVLVGDTLLLGSAQQIAPRTRIAVAHDTARPQTANTERQP